MLTYQQPQERNIMKKTAKYFYFCMVHILFLLLLGACANPELVPNVPNAPEEKGALNISLSFPADISPKLELILPDQTVQTFTQSANLSELEPGTYSYKTDASMYKGVNFNFIPSETTGSINVTAGETANINISFEAQDGALKTALKGVTTDIVVIDVKGEGFAPDGPHGNSQETFSYLKPGSYTVSLHGGEVTIDGFLYKSTKGTQVEVKAGEITTATLVFEAQDGKLELDLIDSFEPSDPFTDYSPAIEVRNSNDQLVTGQIIREATTLERLLPGTYTVKALETSGSGKTFVPKAGQAEQAIAIVAGETLKITVEYEEKVAAPILPTITSFDDDACTYNNGTKCAGKIIRDAGKISGFLTYTELQWEVTGTEPITLTLEPGAVDVTGLSSKEITDIVNEGSPIADDDTIAFMLTATNAAGSVSQALVAPLECCDPGIPDIMD